MAYGDAVEVASQKRFPAAHASSAKLKYFSEYQGALGINFTKLFGVSFKLSPCYFEINAE